MSRHGSVAWRYVAIILAASPLTLWAETVAGPGAGQIAPFTDRLIRLLGTLHPIVVHFPIALLVVAAVAEVSRLFTRKLSPDVAYYCLLIGAGGAIVATLLGLARATSWRESELLLDHRNLGIGLTVLSVALVVIATIARRKPDSVKLIWMRTVGLVFAAALVGSVGQHGGDLTYGPGHLTEPLADLFNPSPQPVTQTADLTGITDIDDLEAELPPAEPVEGFTNQAPDKPTDPGTDEPDPPTPDAIVVEPLATDEIAESSPGIPLGQRVDFLTQILPIFQGKCIDCHGPNKAKGKLRMDSEAFAMRGGRSGQPLWVKGNARESLILKVISTDDELEKMPPPEEGKIVTRAEFESIKLWIEQGARWPSLPGVAISKVTPTR